MRVARRDDPRRALARCKTRHCPGGAERVGDREPMDDALAYESLRQIGGQRRLAAPQMGRAGHLDLDAVTLIRRGPRAIAAAPFGETAQRRGILGEFGRAGREPRQERQRIGERHARCEPFGRGRRVHRREKSSSACREHRGERRFISFFRPPRAGGGPGRLRIACSGFPPSRE